MAKVKRKKSYREFIKKPAWALVNQDGVIATTRAGTKEDAKGIFERAKVIEPGMVVMKVKN